MNLPTKLTAVRIVLTPFFLIIFFIPLWVSKAIESESVNQAMGLISGVLLLFLYAVCELTDFLDGYIARKYQLVTDLGKILDPFSDVLIRITYFLCFASIGIMPIWAFALIMYREFGILFVRLLSIKQGVALAASGWGKGKAILYAISAIFALILVFVDRVFWGSLFTSGNLNMLDESILTPLQRLVKNWGLPTLSGLFILAAIVSVISFLTYLIPFAKVYKEE